jgi:hypothetical protein
VTLLIVVLISSLFICGIDARVQRIRMKIKNNPALQPAALRGVKS